MVQCCRLKKVIDKYLAQSEIFIATKNTFPGQNGLKLTPCFSSKNKSSKKAQTIQTQMLTAKKAFLGRKHTMLYSQEN